MQKTANYTIQPKRKRQAAKPAPAYLSLLRSSSLSRPHAGLFAAVAVLAGVAAPYDAFAVADPSTITNVSGNTSSTLTAPGHLETTQTTNRAIISAPNVDVLGGESWNILQPSSSSAILVRVTNGQPTQIIGDITANGQFGLINGAGTIFGANSQVNVGSLIVSTADISNENFNAGRMKFDIPGNRDASIVNHGHITVAEGGLVALLAPGVENDGVISANMGTVALGAGEAFTVDFYGDNLYSFTVDKKAEAKAKDENGNDLDAAITNKGTVKAAHVYMTASAAKDVVDKAINTTGIVEATTAHMDGGDIVLDGGEGSVHVSGTLRAAGKGAGKKGGVITVASTDAITLTDATVDASGDASGGKVRIGGDAQGGGTMAHATNVSIDGNSVIDASSTNGNGGDVVVWSDKNTDFNGLINISSKNADGGHAEVSSADELNYNGFTDATGKNFGTLLLDPGNWTISNAATSANKKNVAELVTQLGSANVTIDTATAAAQVGAQGTINVVDAINWSTAGSLTLTALQDVTLNASIKNTFKGTATQGAITLNASKTNSGNVGLNSGSLSTVGGDITINTKHFYIGKPASVTSVTGNININNDTGVFNNYGAAHDINTGGNVKVHQGGGLSIQNVIDSLGTIGGAIDIIVGKGVYAENLVIDKKMTITSVDGTNTFITGQANKGQSGTIKINDGVQGVQIGSTGHGFVIYGNDNSNAGISNGAIHLMNNNNGTVIQGNTLATTGPSVVHGVAINNSDNVVIDNNTIANATHGAGVIAVDSDNLSLSNTQFVSNLVGVQLDNSKNANITGVNISDTGTGIYGLNGSSGTKVANTAITNGTLGVLLDGAGTDLTFVGNTSSMTGTTNYFHLQNNAMAGKVLDASQQSFEGIRGENFNAAQYTAARAKTIDFVNDANVGFVFYRSNPLIGLQDVLDQLLQRNNAPLRNVFSYSGQTIDSSYIVSPYNFSVQSLNLSLLAPSAGGPVPATPPTGDLGGLSPSAGGDASKLASLSPAAGGDGESCVNSFLGNGLSDGNCTPAQ